MDIIIISTNTQEQANFWQKRIRELRGIICKHDAFIIAIHEDWPGGAGNGLGTLFAYHKAQEKAKFMYQKDLYELQKKGASVAIYHTAGHGKRLFPITASEHNNKSAVILPGLVGGRRLTILEAVIAQTNRFAAQREGRLSVFWGDQIFIPSKKFFEDGSHHIEILCRENDFPSQSDWEKIGLSSYGLLTLGGDGNVKLLEKVDFHTLTKLISKKKVSTDRGIAVSLGSFSLSPQMTFALLREFEPELEERCGKLDSDPHFWMPLTLDLETYRDLMAKKGTTEKQAHALYKRMSDFKIKFFRLHSEKNFFNAIDLGAGSYWWDYGSIKSYYRNFLKMVSQSPEGEAMKLFFKIDSHAHYDNNNRVIKDAGSCLIDCNIRSGKITNSFLIGVNAESLEAHNCVIINSNLSSAQASHSLFYNVHEKRDVKFSSGTVRADFTLPKTQKKFILYTHKDRDSKEDWEIRLPQNPFSFEEIYYKISSEI